jgi:hypothetical protein
MVRYSRISRQTPVWVTAQAVAALSGRSFPVSRVAKRAQGTRAGAAAVGGAGVSGSGAAAPSSAADAAPEVGGSTVPGAATPADVPAAAGAADPDALPAGAAPQVRNLAAWKLAARRLGRLFYIGLAPIT